MDKAHTGVEKTAKANGLRSDKPIIRKTVLRLLVFTGERKEHKRFDIADMLLVDIIVVLL